MIVVQILSAVVGWLGMKISDAWLDAWPYLTVAYLSMMLVTAVWLWRQSKQGSRLLSAAMFALLTGEGFRLVPGLITFVSPLSVQPYAAGVGRLVCILGTAGFFLLLELYRQQRFGKSKTEGGHRAETAILLLSGVTAAVCFVRYNDWMSDEPPYFWLILRMLLITAMGMLTLGQWYGTVKGDRAYRFLPLALSLVFVFWLPASLIAREVPEISALMIPRTAALIWLILLIRDSIFPDGMKRTIRSYFDHHLLHLVLTLLAVVIFAVVIHWYDTAPWLTVMYLCTFLVIALFVWNQAGRGARTLSAAIFALLAGEAFRLIPGLITRIAPNAAQPYAAGFGRLVCTLGTAGFLFLTELYRQQRSGKEETRNAHRRIGSVIFALFGVTAVVCFLRFNDWMSDSPPLFWLILRNLLLAAMWILTVFQWFATAKTERVCRFMPLALVLVLLFRLPAELLERFVPLIGLLTVPSAAALVWLLWMLCRTSIVRGTGYTFKTYLKRYWTLYLLLLLPIAFFTIFRYYPMSYISLAFKTNNIRMHPWELPLAANGGMQNFIDAFGSKQFGTALFNTIFLNLLDLIIGMPMPILMALLLNELPFNKFKRVTQTVLYLPHFLSWVIISSISLRLFATNDGVINKMIINRIFGQNVPFLSEGGHWRAMYIILGIWKECGWNTIIYLAALTGINAELYEAAEVDGANRWRKIWHVTLPGIRSTIIVLLIMNLGRILGSDFDRPYTLANKAVKTASTTISIFVYEKGIDSDPQQFSLTTAVGLFQSVVCVIFLVASNSLAKKFGERGIW